MDASLEDDHAPRAPPYIQTALSRAGLQLREAPGKRFGVFASKAFAAGSHIITEDAAACSVIRHSPNPASTIGNSPIAAAACAHCLCDDKPLMSCSACSVAHYCCKDHQAAHWPRHKPMCARLKKMQKGQLEDGPWRQHFSIMCMCAELLDCSGGPSSASAPDVSSRPAQSDIMFLCAGRASPAATLVTSTLSQMTGKDVHACECLARHLRAPPIARLRYGDSLCWRAALLHSAFMRFNTGCECLVRVPRNAFTVLSPSGAVADCIPPPPPSQPPPPPTPPHPPHLTPPLPLTPLFTIVPQAMWWLPPYIQQRLCLTTGAIVIGRFQTADILY